MKKWKRIVLIICLIAFVGSGGYLAWQYSKYWVADHDFKKLSEQTKGKTDNDISLKGLHKKNPDLIGWIRIKDTRVDYPVMQTKNDSEYYLRRNFEKEYSISGTPFLDANSDVKLPTLNWLIYGHNMKDGSMFEDILEYGNQKFYENHKQFVFDTIYEKGKWQVIAAGKTQVYGPHYEGFKYYQYPGITSEKDFNKYLKGVLKLSEIDTDQTAEYGDQLLTLSTCSYHLDGSDNGRFIVVAKRVK